MNCRFDVVSRGMQIRLVTNVAKPRGAYPVKQIVRGTNAITVVGKSFSTPSYFGLLFAGSYHNNRSVAKSIVRA